MLAWMAQRLIFFLVPPLPFVSGRGTFVTPLSARWQRRRCSEPRILQAWWTAPGPREDLALPGEDGGVAAGYGSGVVAAAAWSWRDGSGGAAWWQRQRGPGEMAAAARRGGNGW